MNNPTEERSDGPPLPPTTPAPPPPPPKQHSFHIPPNKPLPSPPPHSQQQQNVIEDEGGVACLHQQKPSNTSLRPLPPLPPSPNTQTIARRPLPPSKTTTIIITTSNSADSSSTTTTTTTPPPPSKPPPPCPPGRHRVIKTTGAVSQLRKTSRQISLVVQPRPLPTLPQAPKKPPHPSNAANQQPIEDLLSVPTTRNRSCTFTQATPPPNLNLGALLPSTSQRLSSSSSQQQSSPRWFKSAGGDLASLEEAIMTSTLGEKAKKEEEHGSQQRKWATKMRTLRTSRPSLQDAVMGSITEVAASEAAISEAITTMAANSAAVGENNSSTNPELTEDGKRKWAVRFDSLRTRRKTTSPGMMIISTPSPTNISQQSQQQQQQQNEQQSSSPESCTISAPQIKTVEQTQQAQPFFRPEHNSGFLAGRTMSGQLTEDQEKQIKLFNVICELCFTEETYLSDLETVIEVFLRPLSDEEYITEADVKNMFSNLEDVAAATRLLSSKLHEIYEQLQQPSSESSLICPKIGELFMELCNTEVYSIYCKNQSNSTKSIEQLEKSNNAFRAFLELAKANPVCKRLDLAGFLIKPVQRICKYPLLFNEMIKCLQSDDSEVASLGNASEKIKSMLDAINEHISVCQRQETLKSEVTGGLGSDDVDALFQTEKLIRDAVLNVVGINKSKDSTKSAVVLLDFTLLIGPKGGIKPKHGTFPIIIPLCSAFVVEPKIKEEEGSKDTIQITQIESRQKFVLQFDSYLDKLLWFDDLREAATRGIKHQQQQQLGSSQSQSQLPLPPPQPT